MTVVLNRTDWNGQGMHVIRDPERIHLMWLLDHGPRLSAGIAVAIGILVLIGWVFDLAVLKSGFPGLTAMKANTAVGFILAGISLWCSSPGTQGPHCRNISRVCAGVVLVLGLLGLAENLSGMDFGIDQLLIRDLSNFPGDVPGRMAVGSAISFIALGVALVLVTWNKSGSVWAVQAFAILPGIVAVVALVGYAYDIEGFFRMKLAYTPMALNTAVVFVVLCMGIVNARPGYLLPRIMTSDSAAGSTARRLLPAAIGFPLVMGWLIVRGYQGGYFSEAVGVALFAVANIGGLGTVILWNAGMLNTVDVRRKRAEDQVRRLNVELEQRVVERTAQLEAAVKELEAFSYSVSHDLRTPLRAIDGFSRILLEDYPDHLDDEGKRLLNVVRDNTRKMARLIDDILHFSRMGRLDLALTEIDMEALARDVLEELRPTLAGRRVTFDIHTLPPVNGDRSMVRQVFVNLIANAIKFSRPKENATIEITATAGEAEHVYCIRDNGVGFDMQYQGKLFGVFQRLHGPEEFEGTGIGLAIVRRVIARHGGRVWAEGRINEGAAFYFALPAKEAGHG